jgi:hypothetical protein
MKLSARSPAVKTRRNVLRRMTVTIPSSPKPPNARHHPPPRQIDLHESLRVGGRVHAVVRLRLREERDPMAEPLALPASSRVLRQQWSRFRLRPDR